MSRQHTVVISKITILPNTNTKKQYGYKIIICFFTQLIAITPNGNKKIPFLPKENRKKSKVSGC